MGIYPNRRRARRLNDPEYDVHKSTEEEDGVDPDDIELDYSGVVEKWNDEEEKRERREKMIKSVEDTDELDLDFEEAFSGNREDPDLELDYSGIFKDDEEREREEDAAALGEAVVAALDQCGVLAGEDDEGDSVRKDADAWDDLSTDVEELATMVQEFVEDRRNAAT